MSPRSGAIAIAALLLAATSNAKVAEPKWFRDWLVGCDNLRNCVAIGVGQISDAAHVRIARDGTADARATITIVADMRPGTSFTPAFDDPALPGLPAGPQTFRSGDGPMARLVISKPAAVATFVASLPRGARLTITRTDPPGAAPSDPQVSNVSLAGAVAALLFMDEQQQRLGTTTALIRRGDRPASSIPPRPSAPVIVAPKPGNAPIPAQPPASLLARATDICDSDGGDVEPRKVQRLNGDLLLHWYECRGMSGAYNLSSALLVAPTSQPQAARAPAFRVPDWLPPLRRESPNVIVNGMFDPATMTLTTFHKARGYGDCGSMEEWLWNGREFRLARYAAMPDCLGILRDDWPVLYQARRR